MTVELRKPDSAQTQEQLKKALANMEQPGVRWKLIAQIGAAFVILWVTAYMTVPYIGYWGLGGIGALTVVAAGFGLYAWRLTRKSKAIVDILKEATTQEGKEAALEKLASKGDKDVMSALARAQLLASENPTEAMRVLEGIDMKKTPAMMQDDVRANLALLYLMNNRLHDARHLADDIRMDRQPHPKSKAMYAAVVAEAFARTGKADEAKKLLETFKPGDVAYGEVNAMLRRAQVFTFHMTKNRGLMRQAMETLAQEEPNMMAPFLQKGVQPEIAKLAKEILAHQGFMPKVKYKHR